MRNERNCQHSLGVTFVGLLSAIVLCGHPSAGAENTGTQPQSNAHPELWPRVRPPLVDDRTTKQKLDELMRTLTVEEKVGQIIQADIAHITPADVRQYRLGAILAGGDSGPGGDDLASAQTWLAAADAFYQASMDTSDGRKAIPILWGVDAVHGHNNIVGATLFPHNIALGATRNAKLVRAIGEITARELRVTGQDWTFAPSVAVARDVRWGRTYESYSENPAIVRDYAPAIVRGLQGEPRASNFLRGEHVLATAKHFVGDGGTHHGRDQGDTAATEGELRDIHGVAYAAAISAGVQIVMASYSSWQGTKMHGHHGLLAHVLKQRMGFDGFVVGDWNAHGQLAGCSNASCPAAINAGIDMLMAPDEWKALYASTLAQVRAGDISMQRLDDAVRRILRVKLRSGSFTAGKPSSRPLAGRFDLLGAPEHRAVARQAVRESLVLLKNSNALLPLRPNLDVLVAGDGADNIGMQSGGWTLSWQGSALADANFPGAQSIFAGIRAAVATGGGTATLSVSGEYTAKPDVAIVVFGEKPYAEYRGDIATFAYEPDDATNLNLLRKLRADGIGVVAVFLSGRPLVVTREIDASAAFVAAWLPGSEGGGIADVLFAKSNGKVNHDFKGQLPFSWPSTAMQPRGGPPLYAYGYGLTYRNP